MYMVFTTDGFFEVAIESWCEKGIRGKAQKGIRDTG